MNKKHIHFIKMGGTIEYCDPAYEEINTKLLKLDPSIDSYLRNLVQPHFTYSFDYVCEKDSRFIDEEDRELLARTINLTPHENLIVTHGTFTMMITADFLEKHVSKDKKVIITGSMIPLIGFSASDAGFNLGYSIAAFEYLATGVYVCMNGGMFASGQPYKNENKMRFEENVTSINQKSSDA